MHCRCFYPKVKKTKASLAFCIFVFWKGFKWEFCHRFFTLVLLFHDFFCLWNTLLRTLRPPLCSIQWKWMMAESFCPPPVVFSLYWFGITIGRANDDRIFMFWKYNLAIWYAFSYKLRVHLQKQIIKWRFTVVFILLGNRQRMLFEHVKNSNELQMNYFWKCSLYIFRQVQIYFKSILKNMAFFRIISVLKRSADSVKARSHYICGLSNLNCYMHWNNSTTILTILCVCLCMSVGVCVFVDIFTCAFLCVMTQPRRQQDPSPGSNMGNTDDHKMR